VEILVRRFLGERVERLPHLLRLFLEDLRQRAPVARERRRRRGLDAVEKRVVPVAVERLGDVAIRGRPLLVERPESARSPVAVLTEFLDLGA